MARATSGRDTSRFRYSKMRSSSPAPTGTFRHTSSGNSANEPTSETSTRLAQPQRPQQRARTLAHRGIAQVEHDVAGRQIAHEIFDRREAQHAHVGGQAHRADHRLQRKLGMRLAHQDHAWRRGASRTSRRKARRDSAMRL